MSRRPKPTAIKLLEGNPGGRPINHEEPKVDIGCPEMPKGLRKTAQREWKRITRDLLTLGVLSVIDGKALAMYCDAYADWEQAQRKCVSDGMWYSEPVINSEGMVVGQKHKQAPWFNVKCTAMKMMKAYLIEFGLTPASRTKLKIEKKSEAQDDALLSRDAAQVKAADDVDLNSIDETVIQ